MLKGYGAFWKTKHICPPLIRYKTQRCQSWSCSVRSWARISGHGFRPQFPAANDVNIVFSSLRSCDNSEVTPKRCDWDLLARQFTLLYKSFYPYYAETSTIYVIWNWEVVCPKASKQVPHTRSSRRGQFVYHTYLCKKCIRHWASGVWTRAHE